jgi:energy-coupling factor transporter ATP-binding protein EcfA2
MKITLTSEVVRDKYTDYVRDAYDLDIGERNAVEIPVNFNPDTMTGWNVGLICGASGSGKSVIINRLGGASEARFDNAKSVIGNFENIAPEEAAKVLCAVGLSSVPTWVRPFNVLSNGERYRAELAWILAHAKDGETIRIDEYTSVVDRNVAKAMSHALQKYVRANGLKIILAACHYDIIEWLRPDWIYDLNKGGVLERGDCLPRPTISLRIYRTEPNTWRIFKKHHYMSQELNEAATCFVAEWDDRPVAFCAVLPLPNGALKNAVRESRTVVLPDYQGIGIGSTLTDTIGGIYAASGYTLYSKIVNPALGLHRERSPLWAATGHNEKSRDLDSFVDSNGRRYFSRKSYCHKYIGPPVPGYENLIQPIEKMRKAKSLEGQLSLFENF